MNYVPGRVSVIVPLYNYEQYIKDTIESVLSQDYPDVELIVVDDGSTDNGPAIVESYADRGVRLFRQGRCGYGGTRAINNGIRMATGEFIAWLSADDAFVPGRLTRQVAMLQHARYIDPTVGLAFGSPLYEINDAAMLEFCPLDEADKQRLFAENGVVRWTPVIPDDVLELMPYSLLRRCIVHGCTTLIPRDVLNIVGLFDESLPRTSDYEMWLRIHSFGFHAVYDPQPQALSRVHAVNTADWKDEVPNEAGLVHRQYRREMSLHDVIPGYAAMTPERRGELHRDMGDDFWNERAYDLALEDYWLAAASGVEDRGNRIAEAERNLSFKFRSSDVPGVMFPAPRLLLAYTPGANTARFGQVIRLLMEAFRDGLQAEVNIWLSDPTLKFEATDALRAIYASLGSPNGVPPFAMVSGDLSVAMARVQAYIPVGSWTESVPIELARRMTVPVIYKVSKNGLMKTSKQQQAAFTNPTERKYPTVPAIAGSTVL